MKWEISLISAGAMSKSPEEQEGYYRRSEYVTKQKRKLNSGWFDPAIKGEYLAPNLTAIACRELGSEGDDVRLALTERSLLDGKKVGNWDISVEIAAEHSKLDQSLILKTAQAKETLAIARKTTQAFLDLGVTQRPTFLIESEIGDRAVISGLIQYEPIASTINAMIHDVEAYRSWHKMY